MKVFIFGRLKGEKYLKSHPVQMHAVLQSQAELWNSEYADTSVKVQLAAEFPPLGQRLDANGELVALSTLERIQAGEMELQPTEKIDPETGTIVPKSDLDLLKEGLLSTADFKASALQKLHNQYNEHVSQFVAAYPAQRREGWATLVIEARELQEFQLTISDLEQEPWLAAIAEKAPDFPQLFSESGGDPMEMTILSNKVLLKRQIYGTFSGACNRALDQAVAALQSVSESQSIDSFHSAVKAITINLPEFPEVPNG